ncbi:hypothetical protein FOL47_010677 [Perkinsus chesapeaki]|uniref:Peptidase A1 domain-containing protein n=1 Tax=Perkinsus chesapeaki TaxID=330153 RepID=A0A7J6MPK7_PERCH|nr:hypothetical protein FOL47_010677 [Perkinsus chesapeaki]
MDTGLSGTYVLYKDWYERTYGKDACKQFKMGCYSCPGECNPYAEEKNVGTFADGSTASLLVNERRMRNRRTILALLSVPPTSPQTVPRQLYISKFIKKYAVSICAPGDVVLFTGTLILGDSSGLCAIKSAVTTIPMTEPHEDSHFDSDLSSYGLVSSTGETFAQQVQHGSAIYDTGVFSIYIPKTIFEALLNQISFFAGAGVYVKSIRGVWFITDKGYSSFPTLTFSVGSKQRPFIIRIPPNKYAIKCDGKWCILALDHYDETDILFGRPCFTTYFSSYDYKSQTVSIAEYASR